MALSDHERNRFAKYWKEINHLMPLYSRAYATFKNWAKSHLSEDEFPTAHQWFAEPGGSVSTQEQGQFMRAVELLSSSSETFPDEGWRDLGMAIATAPWITSRPAVALGFAVAVRMKRGGNCTPMDGLTLSYPGAGSMPLHDPDAVTAFVMAIQEDAGRHNDRYHLQPPDAERKASEFLNCSATMPKNKKRHSRRNEKGVTHTALHQLAVYVVKSAEPPNKKH